MEKDLIQAKKYLSEQGYGNGTNYTTNLVAVLLANYAASHPPAAPVEPGQNKPFIVANVREIVDQVLVKDEISYSKMVEMLNDVAKRYYDKFPAAPVSVEEFRESYNKGYLDSKKEQMMDFIKWIGEQDLKRYSEGWCQPGGSNGFHYSDEDLYRLFCNRALSAALPTREQRGEKEKFAIRFSEWLMIQCEYKNHCVWEYRGEEYTQNELIEIFKRTTPLPSPPKH